MTKLLIRLSLATTVLLVALRGGGGERVAASGTPGTIATLAGGLGDGGPATNAALFLPPVVAANAAGDLYVAEKYACRVRKVTGGTITTVAGGLTCGFSGDGGLATAAKLNQAYAVALDGAGNFYIADVDNCRVREVAGGTITTVAGSGVCGYGGDGGPATAAMLWGPTGVAVDGAGKLYLADNARVRKVTAGIITTVAGTGACGYGGDGGPATAAVFSCGPIGVAVDPVGDLYIADSENCRVRKVAGGTIMTVAGSGVCGYGGDGGAATAAALDLPLGVTLDAASNLYIADANNCRVRKVVGGTITTVAGTSTCGYSGDGGAATAARIYRLGSVAVDGAGNLYIADTENSRVREVSAGTITTVAGNGSGSWGGDGGPATFAMLQSPSDVAVDGAGNLYVADTGNCRVRVVSGGSITTFAGNGGCIFGGDGGPAATAMLSPAGVALDGAGDLYIADSGNCRVREVAGGTITTVAGGIGCGYNAGSDAGGPATAASLNHPDGVALDAAGNLYIADSQNCRVRKVTSGTITTVAGIGAGVYPLGCGYSGDGGAAAAAMLDETHGVAVDAAGDLYIADGGNCRIRKVTGGTITTVAGNGTCGYAGDGGPATAAMLNQPYTVALDAGGNLYIADTGNCRVRMVAGGTITTVAGSGGCSYDGDGGVATAAALNLPVGMALDGAGNLYVADYGNRRIRVVYTSSCPFDLDHNGDVGFSDLLTLAKVYGATPSSPNWNPKADFDGSGDVGFPDLLLFAQHYDAAVSGCP